MRSLALVGLLLAGCQFSVVGTSVGDPTGGAGGTTTPQQAPPTSSSPPPGSSASDGGASASTPDLAGVQQRVGTPCMTNAECDPGMMCARTFYVGLQKVDIPGGYCTLDCNNAACPANSFCATFAFGRYCASSCPPDPCRGGYSCCANNGQNGCTPNALCPAKPNGGE